MSSLKTLLLVFLPFLLIVNNYAFGQENIDLISTDNKILEVRIKSRESQMPTFNIKTEGAKTDILGNWSYNNGQSIFKPVIPLATGRNYQVYMNDKLIDSFYKKRIKQASPTVLAFYPSLDTLPENLLKCYIKFSHPMSSKGTYRFISFRDSNGNTLEDVVLPLEPALWNKDQTMLTIWIDPGRVKRDLLRNEHLGKPFESGLTYSLFISSEWKGANMESLSNDYSKHFYISERDENIPKVSEWKISKPTRNSSEPLGIKFNESLDYLTALEGISIYLDGISVSGKVCVNLNEKNWYFTPDYPWKKGDYIIKLKPTIEDLAGNNLIRLFDKDLTSNVKETLNSPQLYFALK